MAPISNNPSLVEGVRYTNGLDSLQRITNSPRRNNNSYDRYKSTDSKNISVSEKSGNTSNVTDYYRYRYNSPAAKLLYTGLTFNEIEKPLKSSASSSGTKKQTQAQNNPAPANYNVFENAVGYYIVSKTNQTKSGSETGNKNKNPMKRKLDKAYHSGGEASTGSLVNIVYY